MIPLPLQAAVWGLTSGGALVIGAGVGYGCKVPPRLLAAVMAFGSGVLISASSFELMEDAHRRGGFAATGWGFLAGAAVFTGANAWLTRRGAHHRKRSGAQQATEKIHAGSGLTLAVAALLDGIPESIAIGISLLEGSSGSAVTVVAIFISNLPEGLSSPAGMKRAGRSARYVFSIWGGIALASALAASLGGSVFQQCPPAVIAATLAMAAGAILAMLADTMIPEAFAIAHEFAGLITVGGFLTAFMLSKAGGS